MLSVAELRITKFSIPVTLALGDAENLEIPDRSVDKVFCFALMRHMPIPVQYRFLSEFSRIAKEGVICTFCMYSFLSYPFWRIRGARHTGSMLLRENLKHLAMSANLNVEKILACTTLLGVERIVRLRKNAE